MLTFDGGGETLSQYVIEDTQRAVGQEMQRKVDKVCLREEGVQRLTDEANQLVGIDDPSEGMSRMEFLQTRYGRVEIVANPKTPVNELWFFDGKQVVAKIVNISLTPIDPHDPVGLQQAQDYDPFAAMTINEAELALYRGLGDDWHEGDAPRWLEGTDTER